MKTFTKTLCKNTSWGHHANYPSLIHVSLQTAEEEKITELQLQNT